MKNFKDVESLDNGLRVSLDWLSFTLTSFDNVDDVVGFLGLDPRTLTPMERGAYGYMAMLKDVEHNISILYKGSESMGIHIDVSGKGIHWLLQSYLRTKKIHTPFGTGYDLWVDDSLLADLLTSIRNHGHLTRLDLAIDDIGDLYFSVDDISRHWHNQEISTKFRTCTETFGSSLKELQGQTVYFGSRKSEIMLRIYNKKLEQNRNLSPDDDRYIHTEWVRWELELKKSRADKVADMIVDGMNLGTVAIGVLANYVRIIEKNDSNRTRCNSSIMWEEFIQGVEKLTLYVAPCEKTIEETKVWLKKQVSSVLAMVVTADGGDLSFLHDLIFTGREKLTTRHKRRIMAYQEKHRKVVEIA